MTENLLQEIDNADNSPSLSTVALEVIRLSRAPDVSVDDFVKVYRETLH